MSSLTCLVFRFDVRATLDDYLLITTALFVASKVEEHPRRIRDVVSTCHHHLCGGEEVLAATSDKYSRLRAAVINTEILLLRSCAFRVPRAGEQPHELVLFYLTSLEQSVSGASRWIDAVAQLAWTFCSDYTSYSPLLAALNGRSDRPRTPFTGSGARSFRPRDIAAGAIQFALDVHGVTLRLDQDRLFDSPIATVSDVQRDMLLFYEQVQL